VFVIERLRGIYCWLAAYAPPAGKDSSTAKRRFGMTIESMMPEAALGDLS
jgi:hypothetical protein